MRHARLERLARDPIDRLRKLRGASAPEPSKLRQAVRRFLAGADGALILDWMVAHSYGRSVPADAPDSALRENEARKRFLDQFLALAEEPSDAQDASTPPRRGRRSSE